MSEIEQYNKDAGAPEGDSCFVLLHQYETGTQNVIKKEIVYGPDTQIGCGFWIVENSHKYPDSAMAVVPHDYAIGYARAELDPEEKAIEAKAMPDTLECMECGWVGAWQKCPEKEGFLCCLACDKPLLAKY